MCLGELGEVVRVLAPAEVEVRVGPRTGVVSLLTLAGPEPVAPGDWLLVHSGYALARLTAQEAADAQRIREGSPP
jgi:hydrogenase expression/formation protein HypC